MKPDDAARVTSFVNVSPHDAFEVFTQQIDTWWRHGPRFRFGGQERGVLRFEAGRSERLVESFAGDRAFEVGRVLVWEPGQRLVFEWRGRDFAPDECTEVEVRFEPRDGGTQLSLEHRLGELGREAPCAARPGRLGFQRHDRPVVG
jgi:uncharacterized protein YndB with AHSA1/START domain